MEHCRRVLRIGDGFKWSMADSFIRDPEFIAGTIHILRAPHIIGLLLVLDICAETTCVRGDI